MKGVDALGQGHYGIVDDDHNWIEFHVQNFGSTTAGNAQLHMYHKSHDQYVLIEHQLSIRRMEILLLAKIILMLNFLCM